MGDQKRKSDEVGTIARPGIYFWQARLQGDRVPYVFRENEDGELIDERGISRGICAD